jgi:hypothetical protein
MSTEESWRNRAKLLGPDNLNALDRWRADNARREEEFAHQRQAEERERQRREESNAVDRLRAEMWQELANLRSEMHSQHEVALEAAGEAIGEFSNKTVDHVEKLIKQIESQLFVTIERRFGELMGRIDAIAPDTRSRSKGFKFSNERDDGGVIDMPNPLRKAMT